MTDFYMKCNTGLKWVKFDKYFFKTFPIFSLELPETLTKRTVVKCSVPNFRYRGANTMQFNLFG